MTKKLLLASSSPRRQEILSQFKIPFSLIPNLIVNEPPISTTSNILTQMRRLAKLKAESSAVNHSEWILAADTIVIFKQSIFGKPSSINHAISMLTTLSGNTHRVISSFCLYHPITKKTITRTHSNLITFSSISQNDILNYCKTATPLDKAGGYGIQDIPDTFIANIRGCYYSVMGLPIKFLLPIIKEYDIV